MTETPRTTEQAAADGRLEQVLTIGIGLIVPAMISGRATLQAMAGICLVLVIAAGFRDRALFSRSKASLNTSMGRLAILAFAGLAVGIVVSSDPQRSFEAWGRTLVFAAAGLLFFQFLKASPDRIRLSARALIAGILAAISIALIGVAGFPWPLQLIKGTLGHVDEYWAAGTLKAFAALLPCVLPLLGLVIWRRTDAWRATCLICVIGSFAVIVAANNKSALAGILIAVVTVSFLVAYCRRGRWIAMWALVTVAATGGTLWLISVLPEPPSRAAVWDWLPTWIIDTHRQQIWHFTWGKITEAPWFGYGINVIDRVPGARDIIAGYKVQFIPSHPHNWALEILAETGLAGFLPTLAAILSFHLQAARAYLKSGDDAALAQIGLGAVFWGSALFNFSIWSSWWLIGYFVLAAIIAATGRRAGARSSVQ